MVSDECRQFYPELHKYLTKKLASGGARLTYERERDQDEISRILATNAGAKVSELRFESVTIGYLKGLDTFSSLDPMGILKVEIMLGFDSISSASPYLLQKQEVFCLHQWSREVPGRFERLEKWIKDAELFFEESNLAQLAQVRATGALRAELERFSLSSLMNQELRAANEQMNSPTPQQRKAVQERLQVPTVADSRLSAGMNAFRRLRGG